MFGSSNGDRSSRRRRSRRQEAPPAPGIGTACDWLAAWLVGHAARRAAQFDRWATRKLFAFVYRVEDRHGRTVAATTFLALWLGAAGAVFGSYMLVARLLA